MKSLAKLAGKRLKVQAKIKVAKSPKQGGRGASKKNPDLMPGTRGKQYADMPEMLRDVFADDPEFVEAHERQWELRRIVRNLEYMRMVRDVSQAEVAQALGCQQSRISKIENGYDADLTVRVLEGYAVATGFKFALTFRANDCTLVDDIEFFLKRIQEALGRIVELAGRDKTIGRAAMLTHAKTAQAAVGMIRESASQLPQLQDDPQPLSVRTEEAEPGAVENAKAANGRATRERMAEVKRKTRREN